MAMTAAARIRHRTFMLGNAPNARRVVFGSVTAYGPVFTAKNTQENNAGALYLDTQITLTLPAGALALVEGSTVTVYNDKSLTAGSTSYKVRDVLAGTADGMESNYLLVPA